MFIFSRCNGAAEKHVEFAYANVAYCMYAIAYQFSILQSLYFVRLLNFKEEINASSLWYNMHAIVPVLYPLFF